jgi:hypothetical protein
MNTSSLPMGLGAGLGMLILILDSRTAVDAARESIQLLTQTVIPSLFPFFFLSNWLTSSGCCNFPILSYIGRFFRLPENCSYLLLPAFLGGYPSGAQAVSSAHENGQLTKEFAEYLLGYCSNAGPSFLFGILSGFFPEVWMCWALWGIHIAGALCAVWILPHSASEHHGAVIQIQRKPFSEILVRSIKITATVCGWVILFRILLAFADRWFLWIFPQPIKVFLTGLLELTNGCCQLGQIQDLRLRFILCSAMLSLGGLCVTMQTQSAVPALNMRYYYQGKGIQTIFSVCIASTIMYRSFLPLFVPSLFLLYAIFRLQKRCSIPSAHGV